MDVLIKEEIEKRINTQSIIIKFKDFKKKLENKNNVFVLVNTPCLEFWFLLHFKQTNKFYPKCKQVVTEIKKNDLLKDYEKSEKYYKKHDNNIYQKLKKMQQKARKNAKLLGGFDFNNCKSAKAEIYRVFEIIGME